MTDPLSHPMFRSPEANRFFINVLAHKRALEHHRHPAPSIPQEPQQTDG